MAFINYCTLLKMHYYVQDQQIDANRLEGFLGSYYRKYDFMYFRHWFCLIIFISVEGLNQESFQKVEFDRPGEPYVLNRTVVVDSHCQQEQSYSGLCSPRRSKLNLLSIYFCWILPPHKQILGKMWPGLFLFELGEEMGKVEVYNIIINFSVTIQRQKLISEIVPHITWTKMN